MNKKIFISFMFCLIFFVTMQFFTKNIVVYEICFDAVMAAALSVFLFLYFDKPFDKEVRR